MNKDFNISTNPYTLSQVKNILADIEIENIPVFEDKQDELREYITTSVILSLSDDIKKLNAMYRQITQNPEIDFALYTFNDLYEILSNFFVSTGDKLISWKKIQSSVSDSQENMGMIQMMEMITKNPSFAKILNTPSETTLET